MDCPLSETLRGGGIVWQQKVFIKIYGFREEHHVVSLCMPWNMQKGNQVTKLFFQKKLLQFGKIKLNSFGTEVITRIFLMLIPNR